jgi:release factor glutamine methyltransferase
LTFTIQTLLAPAVRQLKTAGSPTPVLDAQLWLAHVCGLSRAQLLARPERSVTPEQAAQFGEGLARLAAGEPLPYLTGQAEFYGLTFHVTPATLIPRPETEHLVEAALAFGRGRADLVVADVGTGSGCIVVTLAVHLPAAHLYAIDASPAALAVAARNAAHHNVAERITFLQGHLLAPLPERVHLIAANLPYVADDEWDDLPAGVREYEPAGALRGGKQGLDLIDRLLREAPAVLHPGGAVLLEIGAAQGPAALALARSHIPGADVQLQADYAGRDRLLVVQIG